MSIFDGLGGDDLAEAWSGSNEVVEIWVGDNKVWASGGVEREASIYLDFDDANIPLRNKGTSSATLPVMTASGSITHSKDHAIFGMNGRVFAEPSSTWQDGFTLSMWTRDTPANSGWQTIMHRAIPGTGTLTNEAYIVHNTSATNVNTVAGLKFGSTHREFAANYSLPVSADWFHTVVVWERTSATTFQCRFYINGVSRGIYDGTGYSSTDQFTTEELYIGGNRTSGQWSGRMDDLAMWKRALTPEEVLYLYEMGRSAVPQITTFNLNEMTVGTPYSQQLVANFPVTSWSAVGIPPGLSLNSSTGALSGTPSEVNSGLMTVTATGGEITDETSFTWQIGSGLVSISVPFNSDGDIDFYFPIRGFDSRTSSSSPRNAGWVFSGMLVTGDNHAATYWDILHGQQFKEYLDITLMTGDVVSSSNPLGLIISSDSNLTYQIILEIKDNNIQLVRRTTGSVSRIRTYNTTDGGVRKPVRVVRSGTNVSVYANGGLKFTQDLSSYEYWNRADGGYVGLSVYSASGAWCGRVDTFTVRNY